MHNGGTWYIQRQGFFTFNSAPANLAARASAGRGARSVDVEPGAAQSARASDFQINFAQNEDDWTIDMPRPTYAVWFGDNWRVDQPADGQPRHPLGRRPEHGVAARHPHQRHPDQQRDSARATAISSRVVNDFGYKTDIRDWKNIAPRVGFTYNVGGSNDLVIRGGTGLYFASPVSNVTFSPQFYSQLVAATFANDGRANFITNPTNGVTAEQISPARRRRRRSRRASSRPTSRSRTPGRAASASRSRSTPSPASTST